jgi:hypothetical protein
MIDSFIQNSLNMMILYMSCRSKSVRVSTSASPSNLVNKGKNNLLSNDLLWRIDDRLLMLNIHYTEFHALELVDCLFMLSIHIYTMIRWALLWAWRACLWYLCIAGVIIHAYQTNRHFYPAVAESTSIRGYIYCHYKYILF